MIEEGELNVTMIKYFVPNKYLLNIYIYLLRNSVYKYNLKRV
jgi:hypothetical protein